MPRLATGNLAQPEKVAAAPDAKPDEQVASGKDAPAPETAVAKDETKQPADIQDRGRCCRQGRFVRAGARRRRCSRKRRPGPDGRRHARRTDRRQEEELPVVLLRRNAGAGCALARKAGQGKSRWWRSRTKPSAAQSRSARPRSATAAATSPCPAFARPTCSRSSASPASTTTATSTCTRTIDGPPVVLASAAGLARLAPNGLLKQRESVDVACLKPSLVRVLKTVERHYGKKMVVTSGYRSPSYNRKVNGAKKSQHMYCAAADVQVPGVSKWELAKYRSHHARPRRRRHLLPHRIGSHRRRPRARLELELPPAHLAKKFVSARVSRVAACAQRNYNPPRLSAPIV